MRQTIVALGLVLVVMAAGASARNLDFFSHTRIVEQGTPATFFAAVKVMVNEKFTVNYLEFQVVDKEGVVETCRFKTDGTMISGCSGVAQIIPIDKEYHNRWGYHFGAKKLMYRITLSTDGLLGSYKARLSANVKTNTATKDFRSRWFRFRVVEEIKHIPPKKTG